jgi:hypothetical protein
MVLQVFYKSPTSCHNPTNNPKQLKTTFVGVVLLTVRKAYKWQLIRNKWQLIRYKWQLIPPGIITIMEVLTNLGS